MIRVILAFVISGILFVFAFSRPSPSPPVIPDPKPGTNQHFSLIAVGDVMLGRTINSRALQKNDFVSAFLPTADLLKSADITVANLESPLIPDCPVSISGTIFCADRRHLEGLLLSGIDIVSLANNHTYDYGKSGFNTTVEFLESSGIKTVFPGHPAQITVNKTIIEFLGYNDIWNRSEKFSKVVLDDMISEVTAAEQTSDLTIVMFHWGNEYTKEITDRQKLLARTAIDNGADLIIGSHPHWTQPNEIYSGKHIDYSLGNYIFDQYWSTKTRLGHLVKYDFNDSKLIDTAYLPVYQESDGRTVLKVVQ